MIKKSDPIFHDYISKLVDRIYKILPLYEERNEGLFKNIQSLIFELNNLPNVVEKTLDADYIVLLATLESICDEALFMTEEEDEYTHSLVRREVFKCVNIVGKIGERAIKDGDFK